MREIKGKLKKIEDKGKIYLLSFETENGELSVSVFKEDMPNLKEGGWYVFKTTQYKDEERGKVYINLAPKFRGKRKVGLEITEYKEDVAQPAPMEEVKKETKPEQKPETNGYELREKRIIRQNSISNACLIMQALLNSPEGREEVKKAGLKELTLQMAEWFEEWVYR